MVLAPIKALFDAKAPLREKMKAERRAISETTDAGLLARHAAQRFISDIPLPTDAVVALYHPTNDELDTEPLFDALTERGVAIALPITPKARAPLSFRRFEQGGALIEGRHGILEPTPDAPDITPDIVVAPLLAFTRRGERLGYGGGYYDRTLGEMRAARDVLAVGYGFARQEVERFPTDRHDERLDWIVTERAAIRARADS